MVVSVRVNFTYHAHVNAGVGVDAGVVRDKEERRETNE